MYLQTGKNTKWTEILFLFCDWFFTVDTVTALHMEFCRERVVASLGPSGLTHSRRHKMVRLAPVDAVFAHLKKNRSK